ncbi:hypothetical protein BOTNAR_0088g00320 [Botryotinia narcissicola]|uniref:Uncharacterized protein n=1 Tax=Botryotinia narcissicola TaxID=278944 RepID=A0A4Z1IYF5_9HELO|nr:hypothetical protein BOTNAR_0088g00320 [Botryotinia narcissicola]
MISSRFRKIIIIYTLLTFAFTNIAQATFSINLPQIMLVAAFGAMGFQDYARLNPHFGTAEHGAGNLSNAVTGCDGTDFDGFQVFGVLILREDELYKLQMEGYMWETLETFHS